MTRRHGRKRKRVSMHGLQGDERRAEDRERGGMLKGCSWQLYPDGREQDEDREEGKRTKGSHTENAKKAVHRCISALFRCVCVCVCVCARARVCTSSTPQPAKRDRPYPMHASRAPPTPSSPSSFFSKYRCGHVRIGTLVGCLTLNVKLLEWSDFDAARTEKREGEKEEDRKK